MSYNKSPFKMAPKSPLTKALKGNQGKLPQHLQEAIKAGPESPAKAMTGPGVQKEAGKTGTAGSLTPHEKSVNREYEARKKEQAAASSGNKSGTSDSKASGSKASGSKPKYDKELNSLVASRKGLKKGTAEYNKVQNRINEKLGSSVRRRVEETTKVASKKPSTSASAAADVASSRGLTPKPAAKKPAASKGPSQADKFENVLAKENAKGPMGSETGSKAPAKKPAAKKPVVAKKPVAKKTVGQKVKGTVKKARLAQLDRKANRQEARAENKTARKTKRAEKLTARANKLTGK
jgi:hypothetical protein